MQQSDVEKALERAKRKVAQLEAAVEELMSNNNVEGGDAKAGEKNPLTGDGEAGRKNLLTMEEVGKAAVRASSSCQSEKRSSLEGSQSRPPSSLAQVSVNKPSSSQPLEEVSVKKPSSLQPSSQSFISRN